MKKIKLVLYTSGLLLLLLSISFCMVDKTPNGNGNGGSGGISITVPSPPTNNNTSSSSRRRNVSSCESSGRTCEGDDDCEDICRSLFSNRGDRNDCEELGIQLVEDFEELIEELEDGETNIDVDVFECLISISEDPIVEAIEDRNFNKRDAQDFLDEIVDNEDLAQILEDEDNDRTILSTLFKQAGENDLGQVLEADPDSFNFLYRIGEEGAEVAFEYFESYVDHECEDNSNDCPRGKKMHAYCKGFLQWDESDVDDFLEEADVFEDEYANEIENLDYAYDTSSNSQERGSFLDYCRIVSATESPINTEKSCPSGGNRVNPDLSVGRFRFGSESSGVRTGSLRDDRSNSSELITKLEIKGTNLEVTVRSSVSASNVDYLYLQKEGRSEEASRFDKTSSSGSTIVFNIGNTNTQINTSDEWYVLLSNDDSDCKFHAPLRDYDDLFED